MTAERWARLTADLAAAGVEVTVTEKPYSQLNYGRVEHGVTRQIIIGLADGGLLTVRDKYGRGGKWYGWQVDRDDKDGYVAAQSRTSTRRSVTVAQVIDDIRIGGGTRSLRRAS